MVGGKIIEVKHEGEKVRLWCVGTGPEKNDELAIYVKAVPPELKPGDKLWWQGRLAFWTPVDRHVLEEPLERVGFSFDPRKENYR